MFNVANMFLTLLTLKKKNLAKNPNLELWREPHSVSFVVDATINIHNTFSHP